MARSRVATAERTSPGKLSASLRATVRPMVPSPAMAIRLEGNGDCSCAGVASSAATGYCTGASGGPAAPSGSLGAAAGLRSASGIQETLTSPLRKV